MFTGDALQERARRRFRPSFSRRSLERSCSPLSGLRAGFSNERGVATILVPVTKRMFGKKLFVRIAARTPKARAVALRSVSLPTLR